MTDPKLLVEVLRVAADQRQRVATKAATELLATAGKDQRAGAMRIARLLAEAGQLVEVADQLEAGDLQLVPVDVLPPAPTVDELREQLTGEPAVERKLTVVPPPTTEEPEPVTPKPPATPTEAAVDAAVADAEAILEQAYPDDDPELGTVLTEEGRAPEPRPVAIETVGDARQAIADGADPAAVAAAVLAPDDQLAEVYLPPGQGDDDDLSDLADVADLEAFDAERADLDESGR